MEIKTSKLQSDIVSYLIEYGDSTVYSMSRNMSYPWKTIKFNLDRLEEMGIVNFDGKRYSINNRYTDDNFIQGIHNGLEDIFAKFADTNMTAEGVLYFIQYVANHTKLKFKNGDVNGRNQG